MTPEFQTMLESARTAVNQLVAACQKRSPLYTLHPQQVAQVSRTGKWLLNALTALDRHIQQDTADTPS
jgi:hypothetical protein